MARALSGVSVQGARGTHLSGDWFVEWSSKRSSIIMNFTSSTVISRGFDIFRGRTLIFEKGCLQDDPPLFS